MTFTNSYKNTYLQTVLMVFFFVSIEAVLLRTYVFIRIYKSYAYSEPCQTSNMQFYMKIVNGFG